MKNYKFVGGIHPPANKLSAKLPIEKAPLPKKVILPLAQHIGAPNEAIVAKGEEVIIGQVIGQNKKAFVSALVHASISGKVIDVAPYPHPLGLKIPAIVIEASDEQPDAGYKQEKTNILSEDPAHVQGLIYAAGLVGLGGATFPTHVKLSPPENKPIDTLIINGAECEPYLTADHRIMLEYPNQLIKGIQALMHILGIKQAIIGIEYNKPDAIEVLSHAVKNTSGIQVAGLKVKYPQGSEKHLIKALLNREVPLPPGLPMDVGVVVQNIGTIYAVYEALYWGKPLIERVVTVTGSGIKTPKNLLVRIGTPIADIIEYCGGLTDDAAKIILGGPMMGMAQYTTEVPVIKGTSGILVQTESEVPASAYHDCIRCGKCVSICPMCLLPNLLGIYAEKQMFAEAEAAGVLNCLECGCCVYVCPANRPMIQMIKHAKASIMAKRRKAKAA